MLNVMVEPDVAKKSASSKAKPEEKAVSEEKARKPMVLQIRGSDEFKQWYEEFARFDGLTPTALFDRAIRRYAKEVGFTKEAPLR